MVGELSTKNEEVDIYMINEDFKMDLDISGSEELKEITLFIKHEAGFARSDKTISSLKVAIYD